MSKAAITPKDGAKVRPTPPAPAVPPTKGQNFNMKSKQMPDYALTDQRKGK
jgi:hypothetical protein